MQRPVRGYHPEQNAASFLPHCLGMARLLDFIIFGVPRSGTRMRIPRAFS
jgi:hypothetical protein